METSRCGDPGRSHGWRAGHARRSRRIPAAHSAACPWRPRVSDVRGAPSAEHRTHSASRDSGLRTYGGRREKGDLLSLSHAITKAWSEAVSKREPYLSLGV